MRPHQPLPETIIIWYRVISSSCPFKFFQVGAVEGIVFTGREYWHFVCRNFSLRDEQDATGPFAGKTQLQRNNMSSRQVWAREERRWPRKDKRMSHVLFQVTVKMTNCLFDSDDCEIPHALTYSSSIDSERPCYFQWLVSLPTATVYPLSFALKLVCSDIDTIRKNWNRP